MALLSSGVRRARAGAAVVRERGQRLGAHHRPHHRSSDIFELEAWAGQYLPQASVHPLLIPKPNPGVVDVHKQGAPFLSGKEIRIKLLIIMIYLNSRPNLGPKSPPWQGAASNSETGRFSAFCIASGSRLI